MNNYFFNKLEKVKQSIKDYDTIICKILGGLTRYLYGFDQSINRLVKEEFSKEIF